MCVSGGGGGAAGLAPLSRQASRLSPRDSTFGLGSYNEQVLPDSPLFAGSQHSQFNSAADMLQVRRLVIHSYAPAADSAEM